MSAVIATVWAASAILGGGPADPAEWPDVVALLVAGEQLCSGVLIAPDRVLTAAHCDAAIDGAVIGAAAWRDGPVVPVIGREAHDGGADVAVLTLGEAQGAPLRPW
ncbi:MAG TPA: trypsin-like serine protease, partial [Myxococcota bacterium]|nr:trypsin-like serine protease [Myxococcota bacterium]